MLMDIIESRHSIRKYTEKQISRDDLEKILQAGNLAPNAGGAQRSIFVGVHNPAMTKKLGIMNLAKFDRSNLLGSYVSAEQPSVIDDATMKNGFYGAPDVIVLFGEKNFAFREGDAFCAAENMVLQATELGISSCIISRGEETFAGEEGEKILREWQIPENYSAVCFVILGYIDGKNPQRKKRKDGRVRIVE